MYRPCLVRRPPMHGYPDLQPGSLLFWHTVGGNTLPIRVYIPPGFNRDVPHRIIFHQHGAGVEYSGSNEGAQLADPGPGILISEGGNTFPDVVIFPQGDETLRPVDSAATAMATVAVNMSALATIAKQVYFDPKRICATGHSRGASFCWATVYHNPGIFCCIGASSQGHEARDSPYGQRITYNDAATQADALAAVVVSPLAALPARLYMGVLDTPSGTPYTETDAAAYAAAGIGNPPFLYTEISGADHEPCTNTVWGNSHKVDDGTIATAFLAWLRAQSK